MIALVANAAPLLSVAGVAHTAWVTELVMVPVPNAPLLLKFSPALVPIIVPPL